jgi:DNA-binding protein H-NS
VDLMSPKKRPGRGKGDRSYISYVDPNNAENVYVRGVLPRWMKDQMASNGLDASSKEDRDRFKEQFLTRVEG